MANCKLCGKINTEKNKIKNGYICDVCYSLLPDVVKLSVRDIDDIHLKALKKMMTKHKSPYFLKCENVYICEDGIQINEWEMKFKFMDKIYLKFHPTDYDNGRFKAKGKLGVVIETINPHMIIEEPFMEMSVEYRIHEKDIVYIIPESANSIFREIQKILDNKKYSLKEFREKYYMGKHDNNKKQDTAFDKAKRLYNVELPYTEEMLRHIRKRLIMEVHPDQGGSAEKSAEINNAFDLLVRFAADRK